MLPQVVLDPLMWPHADYLTATLIQVHLLKPQGDGASSLVATGTLYTSLQLLRWALPSEMDRASTHPCPGLLCPKLVLQHGICLAIIAVNENQRPANGSPGKKLCSSKLYMRLRIIMSWPACCELWQGLPLRPLFGFKIELTGSAFLLA